MIYISLFLLIHPSQQRGEYGVKPTYRRNLCTQFTNAVNPMIKWMANG